MKAMPGNTFLQVAKRVFLDCPDLWMAATGGFQLRQISFVDAAELSWPFPMRTEREWERQYTRSGLLEQEFFFLSICGPQKMNDSPALAIVRRNGQIAVFPAADVFVSAGSIDLSTFLNQSIQISYALYLRSLHSIVLLTADGELYILYIRWNSLSAQRSSSGELEGCVSKLGVLGRHTAPHNVVGVFEADARQIESSDASIWCVTSSSIMLRKYVVAISDEGQTSVQEDVSCRLHVPRVNDAAFSSCPVYSKDGRLHVILIGLGSGHIFKFDVLDFELLELVSSTEGSPVYVQPVYHKLPASKASLTKCPGFVSSTLAGKVTLVTNVESPEVSWSMHLSDYTASTPLFHAIRVAPLTEDCDTWDLILCPVSGSQTYMIDQFRNQAILRHPGLMGISENSFVCSFEALSLFSTSAQMNVPCFLYHIHVPDLKRGDFRDVLYVYVDMRMQSIRSYTFDAPSVGQHSRKETFKALYGVRTD